MKYKLLHHEAKAPYKKNPSDAGYDLSTYHDVTIEAGKPGLIPLGVGFEINRGFMLNLHPRSSLMIKKGLLGLVGVIDEDYRGEVMLQVLNFGSEDIVIPKHERVAQVVPALCVGMDMEETYVLNETERGQGGFGSTGEKAV